MVENQVHKPPGKKDMMNDINPEGKDDEKEVVGKQLVATEDAPRLGKEESMTKDWKMKVEIRPVQSEVLDDAKEAIESNKEDVGKQDLAPIGSKAKNKELDPWGEKSYGGKDKDDDAEEEAKTKVGTSADQKKPLADKEEVKMILVRKKIRKTRKKIMRRLHKHLEDAEEKGS
jgi:hypothetical protein